MDGLPAPTLPRKKRRKSRIPKRLWTDEDNRVLTLYWGDLAPRQLRTKLNRTWRAICGQVLRLELPLGLPQGTASLSEASVLLGHDREALRAIAKRNNVVVRRHPCPLLGGRDGMISTRRTWCVDLADLTAAVEYEDRETETVHAAAVRRHLNDETLMAWLRAGQVVPPRDGKRVVYRVATVDIDRVVNVRRGRSVEGVR